MTENASNLQVGIATLQDLSLLTTLESAAHITPWSEQMLIESLTNQNLFLKLSLGNKLIGYQVLMPIVDELELLNIVISTDYQGKGYGCFLLNHLVQYAQTNKLSRILLEVRESNLSAIHLYQKFGFEKVGLRKNYYVRPTENNQKSFENAIIMQLSL